MRIHELPLRIRNMACYDIKSPALKRMLEQLLERSLPDFSNFISLSNILRPIPRQYSQRYQKTIQVKGSGSLVLPFSAEILIPHPQPLDHHYDIPNWMSSHPMHDRHYLYKWAFASAVQSWQQQYGKPTIRWIAPQGPRSLTEYALKATIYPPYGFQVIEDYQDEFDDPEYGARLRVERTILKRKGLVNGSTSAETT